MKKADFADTIKKGDGTEKVEKVDTIKKELNTNRTAPRQGVGVGAIGNASNLNRTPSTDLTLRPQRI